MSKRKNIKLESSNKMVIILPKPIVGEKITVKNKSGNPVTVVSNGEVTELTYGKTVVRCDCCARPVPEVYTACSSLGAVSFGYCGECLTNGAEPLGMIEGLLEDIPLDGIKDDYKNNIRFFRDGKYILLKDYTKE